MVARCSQSLCQAHAVTSLGRLAWAPGCLSQENLPDVLGAYSTVPRLFFLGSFMLRPLSRTHTWYSSQALGPFLGFLFGDEGVATEHKNSWNIPGSPHLAVMSLHPYTCRFCLPPLLGRLRLTVQWPLAHCILSGHCRGCLALQAPVLLPGSSSPLLTVDFLSRPPPSPLPTYQWSGTTLAPSQSPRDTILQLSSGDRVTVRATSYELKSHRNTAHIPVICKPTETARRNLQGPAVGPKSE